MNRAAVITISDSCYARTRDDTAGRALGELLRKAGWTVVSTAVVPDEIDSIRAEIRRLTAPADLELLVTTGGTGIAPRDVTPEAVRPLLQKEIPGIGEVMRARGLAETEKAALSRSLAGIADRTLVICVPGSEQGAVASLEAVLSLLPHARDLIRGKTAHGVDT